MSPESKDKGIKITFSPTAPTEYNASLNAKCGGACTHTCSCA